MGELIVLADRRARRRTSHLGRPAAHGSAAVTFWFDLASPFSYFAAERADSMFGELRWRPAYGSLLRSSAIGEDAWARLRELAERRAQELHMPLVWPEAFSTEWRGAARVAAHAAELGRGPAFVIAAGRLAFCGGFDLDDPEVLMEAGEAAGLTPTECLGAAADTDRDLVIETATDCLEAAGAASLPTVQVGARLFSGERALGEALAACSAGGAPRAPLPHVS
jgi:2-hydroxychromene-2-carboxylate isomerase